MKRCFAGFLAALTLLAIAGAAPAAAATRVVDDDKRQCATAQFTSIQAAVNAAQPGDTISVCPGLYPEQVQIGDNDENSIDKRNLRLISQSRAGAIVRSARPFSVNGRGEDLVSGIEISRFRMEGSGVGVVSSFGGPMLIADNLILTASGGVDQGDATRSTLRGNLIRDYATTGVDASVGSSLSLGTSVDMRSNTLIGRPGSKGVSLFAGTLGGGFPNVFGLLFGNTIASNGVAGVDIFNGVVDVKANKIFGSGVGLSLTLGSGMAIENNEVTNNREQGILVIESFENHFASNNARANGGIDCEDRTTGSGTAGTGNTWTANLGYESAPPGICKRTVP